MGAVWLVFRTEFRRRWRSWLVLVVLIAVVGGLVLGAAAAGRRTASAFPRSAKAHGYDYALFNDQPLPGLARLPDVASVITVGAPFYGNVACSCGPAINNTSSLSIFAMSSKGLDRVTNLVAGRMPVPSSPDELLASFNLQQAYGVHVGTVITTRFYTASQDAALLGGANLNPKGATFRFHVVGIEAAENEFPAGQGLSYGLYTTQAFIRTIGAGDGAGGGTEYLVRLRHGAADLPRFSTEVSALHPQLAQSEDDSAAAVAASIHPQAVGWWVLALLAGLAGLAVIGQALGRQSVVEREEYPTLAAVGLRRHQLVVLGTARNVLVGVAGAVGAIGVAYVLSPLAPVGEARLAEPSTGLAFDSSVLLLGALITVVAVLVLGIWPTLRASRLHMSEDRALGTHPSSIVAKVAATGAPPSAVIGLRHALERGRGATSVPVGTAFFGTVLAVLALCATAVFGASLSHLTATPALYGQNYQLVFANNPSTGGNPAAEVAALKRDRTVVGIMYATRNEISINGVSVLAVVGEAARGPLLLSTVAGRLPTGQRDIALGTTTLHQVAAHLGSIVDVTVQLPNGATRTAPFHVVGTESFPGLFGLGGLGSGASFAFAGYMDVACPPGPTRSSCEITYQKGFHASQKGAVFAKVAAGPIGKADVTRYIKTFQGAAARPTTPLSLINFGEAVNFPLILGVMLALFGVATLMHLLVVSVMRRRREMGLLKALGLVNSQIGASVLWQATTVALVGVVVGVPLGIIVGRVIWNAFATNLGVVPAPTVPGLTITALVAGVVLVANVLAVAPALAAARTRSAGQLLRTQ